jgi:alkanesulfonate monooxygenase SsuD/methylene tetrahydromethanopterin reductase-like flavin-dependent oxidoreductase (luciferase family)
MRPILALYVGGMGSVKQNFYNRLMASYGFERAAQEVQELYLAGKKTEAMFALPDELIDLVSIVGPRDRVKQKIRAFRDAGVDTLIVWPVMPDHEERKEQLRAIAELNEEI